jgi:hypothetical protein
MIGTGAFAKPAFKGMLERAGVGKSQKIGYIVDTDPFSLSPGVESPRKEK